MFNAFLRDESGAITIDWVALTAGILLLGVALVYGIFNGGVAPLSGTINANLASVGAGAGTGDAPVLNGADFSAAAPPACNGGGSCLYDTDGDGNYDSFGDSDGNVKEKLPEGQLTAAEAKDQGYTPS